MKEGSQNAKNEVKSASRRDFQLPISATRHLAAATLHTTQPPACTSSYVLYGVEVLYFDFQISNATHFIILQDPKVQQLTGN